MIVDLSKIPEGCALKLSGHLPGTSYSCSIAYRSRNKSIEATGCGSTPQEAVDNAINEFEG